MLILLQRFFQAILITHPTAQAQATITISIATSKIPQPGGSHPQTIYQKRIFALTNEELECRQDEFASIISFPFACCPYVACLIRQLCVSKLPCFSRGVVLEAELFSLESWGFVVILGRSGLLVLLLL